MSAVCARAYHGTCYSQSDLIRQYHDAPGAAHLGPEKTAAKVRHVRYWVGMLHDINKYCHECSVCQASKTPTPMKAPLVNVPIGKPWEMVAVDILEVPVSYHNNRYLLVTQDYFTKWLRLCPFQTTLSIADELVRSSLVMVFLLLSILIRDGILRVPYCSKHWKPLRMGWLNDLIEHSSRCLVHMSESRQIGNAFSLSSCSHIEQQSPHTSFPKATAYEPASYHGQLHSKLALGFCCDAFGRSSKPPKEIL